METDRGGVTNTGMYFATEENPTVRGAFGAGAGGVVSGAAGGQGGHLVPNGLLSKYAEYGVGAAASVAGGAVDHGIRGKEYGWAEMAFDGGSGALLTQVPSATDTDPNPTWQHHAVDGIVSAETGAIVEGTKDIVGDHFKEKGTELW